MDPSWTMRLANFIATSAKRSKPTFRAGDVLTLKSGGRMMTATWAGPVVFAPGNWLICQWFSDAGELQQELFPEETLVRAHEALTY
jgi:uncharacterized protein YodC (DUF2158 family)